MYANMVACIPKVPSRPLFQNIFTPFQLNQRNCRWMLEQIFQQTSFLFTSITTVGNKLTRLYLVSVRPINSYVARESWLIRNSSIICPSQPTFLEYYMIIDSHISQTLSYPLHLLSPHYASPLLNKILTIHPSGSIFSAYSDGQILQHSQTDGLYQFRTSWQPYQNAQIIDIKTFSQTKLALCTHTEVTLYDLVKNRNTSLKGHQSTPLAVSCHPVSPIVISVSSLLIEHDVRMAKPINVNFVTPPVYSVQYFTDGQYYILSGQPCRIGREKWYRTLLNGISTPSINSKYILSNDLEGSITLWEWRTSKSVLQLQNIKNTQTYQPIHFGLNEGNIEQILFLEDDGTLLRHNICKNLTSRHQIIERVEEQDNWKMEVKNINYTTHELIVYQHSRAITQVVKLSELGKE